MMMINNYNKICLNINYFWDKILEKISPKKRNFKNYLFVKFSLEDLINHYTILYSINESQKNNTNKILLDRSNISDDNLINIINILKKKKKLFRIR